MKVAPNKKVTRRRLLIFFGAFCLAWAALMAFAGVVYAISDPGSITIEDVRAYESVLEDSDLLIVVEYNLTYSSLPTEIISDAYFGRFRRGTTELNSVEPFAFNDKGYGRGIFSMYWSSAQKTTDSIEFENPNAEDYLITLQGKPLVFAGGAPTTTTGTITWRSTLLLDNDVIDLARKFENDPGWNDDADFDDLIGGANNLLTTTGEEYFAQAIAQLQSMTPQLFQSAVTVPDFTQETSSRSFEESLNTFWDNNWVDTRFETMATTLRLSKQMLTAVAALSVMVGIAAFSARLLDNTENGQAFGMMTFAVTLPMFTAINWMPLNLTIVIASLAVLVVGWTLFARRAGA